MKSWRAMVLLVTLALGACAAPATRDRDGAASSHQDRDAIFVIRHLHKAQGDDPPLNSEGTAAAERLAEMLADKGIVAIYATATRRAMETAAPLSRRIGVTVTQYDARQPEALVTSVTASEGAVLVVGHSNTVPDLVARFGGHQAPELTEQDYGTVFMIDATGKVHELVVD
ncbi:SixA phosphatase family protein [Qipengyuania sp. CAU 1752]